MTTDTSHGIVRSSSFRVAIERCRGGFSCARCPVGYQITVFNLLELAGIFASANRAKESRDVFEKYLRADNISILFPDLTAGDARHFWQVVTSECFARIQRGMRLGDAVILWTLETNENIDSFITWNTKHFKDKTSLKILTPSEFLQPS